MARTLASVLHATLVVATTSRLLVELNRSPGREFRQSPIMHGAPAALREEVTRCHYVPYRREIEALVRTAVERGERVLHVSSHSFTAELGGTIRRADVGLLYDPSRILERELCARWQVALAAARPRLVVRRNYPYRGASDGFTSYLRERFPARSYLGIELEVNQKHARDNAFPAALRAAIAGALREALASGFTRSS
jgi:predicted N-formylglutamate amidohydrolase